MEWNERKGKETEGGGREGILEKICYAMRLKCEATMILSEAAFDHRRKVHGPREGGRNERRNTNNKIETARRGPTPAGMYDAIAGPTESSERPPSA